MKAARIARLLVLALMALALLPSRASADVAITWEAPPECTQLPAFQRAFERAMGTALLDLGAPNTQVHVAFTEVERGWVVRVQVDVPGASRTRELSVQSRACHRLDEGVLVVVGLLVDEVSREAESHPIALPEPVEAPLVSAPPAVVEPPSSPAAAPEVTHALEGAFILGARARVDALPGLAVGLHAGGELQLLRALRLGLGIELYPEATSTRPDGSGATVSALAPYVALSGLASVTPWLELGGSVALDVMLLEARGTGLDETRTSRGLALDVLAEARMNLALTSWLWLRIHVGLGVAPVRARILYRTEDRIELLHTTSWLSPTLGLAFELRLGS